MKRKHTVQFVVSSYNCIAICATEEAVA
uniref:Uncharacterized protein n=1 Tax=Arundo donax TaxID=35708 RepID=A0A0A9GTQ1_ARUDO